MKKSRPLHYYEMHFVRYLQADKETRKASRDHWLKCHRENIKADRDDLIIFSAKMLASIDLADAIIADQMR